jgi:DNA processing protein
MDERVALLGLLLGSRVSWTEITDRVESRGSASQVLDEFRSEQQALFGPADDVESWTNRATTLLDQWSDEGIHFSPLLDADYPQQLLTIHERPPFVTWRGVTSPNDRYGVAIVGTRGATPLGVSRARELAIGLAESGVTVVSGLAAGIDTAAHRGALDAGGRTVAVLGTGLNVNYPKQNAELQAEIARKGMLLSQFLPDSPPTKSSFPMRNAVMSGFSLATVVIEAGWKSGARMQARLALQHGRRVLLLSDLRVHDWAREYGARPGASFVDSVEDILGELNRLQATQETLVDS